MDVTYSDTKAYCPACDRPSIEPADAVWTERRICSPCHVRELETENERMQTAIEDALAEGTWGDWYGSVETEAILLRAIGLRDNAT